MPIDKQLAARAIDAFLRALGRNPDHEPELQGTGARVADAWADELLDGYDIDIGAMLRHECISTPHGDPGLLIVRGIAITTICPHHLLPAYGTADVYYRPGPALLGLGSIPRLVEAWAHRLTLQETIGTNVVRSLVEYAGVRGAACRLSLAHTCLTLRGERQTSSAVETIAFAGCLQETGTERDLVLAALNGARVTRPNME